MKIWAPQGGDHLGALPSDVDLEAYAGGPLGPSDPATVDVFVPPPFPTPEAQALLRSMTKVRLVQALTAGVDGWKEHVPAGAVLCNARGVHAASTSEWVVTAILAFIRRFPQFRDAQRAARWEWQVTDQLAGKRALVIGAGTIGEATCERLAPFGVTLTRVARKPRAGVHGVDELPALLPQADIVVLLVPLTAETTRLVDAAFLAHLPDGALVVNAARGPVVDTDALVAELESGRLSAALDVTDPEPLPPSHPLWLLPNVLITPHVGGSVRASLHGAFALAGDQVRRLYAGEALVNVVTGGY